MTAKYDGHYSHLIFFISLGSNRGRILQLKPFFEFSRPVLKMDHLIGQS